MSIISVPSGASVAKFLFLFFYHGDPSPAFGRSQNQLTQSHKATKRRPYPGIAYFVIFVASCEYHYLALSPCSQCPPWFNHPRKRVFDQKTAFGPPATPHFTL